MSKNILITGATGNVGEALIRALFEQTTSQTIIAGVRNIEKSKPIFSKFNRLQYRIFDFENIDTYDSALDKIDTLFLLRPPHIANVEQIFQPLIDRAVCKGVRRIVFLSVQGADELSFIPHSKIEKLIIASGIDYCFLRPSYFMQNLITTLKADIDAGCIVLPAGNALFNWIDVNDIGRAGAVIIEEIESYTNQKLDITGAENLSFAMVVEIINAVSGKNLKYKSANLISFYLHKKRQNVSRAMIMVMVMLHFLPRLQQAPRISNNYRRITGCQSTSLKEFVRSNLKSF